MAPQVNDTKVNTTSESGHRNRIWFFPNKFWAATKGMPEEQVSSLMAEVESLAAAGDVQALRKYSFVFVGDPYDKSAA
jgi:tripartite-type tricarboxylate transporter receptor subunit TctC